MAAKYPNTEPSDLYTRDFLVRVPVAFQQDSQLNQEKQHSTVRSFVVGCLSIAAMVVYQLTTNRFLTWDFNTWILVLITGVVGFALAHIFGTLFFGEK